MTEEEAKALANSQFLGTKLTKDFLHKVLEKNSYIFSDEKLLNLVPKSQDESEDMMVLLNLEKQLLELVKSKITEERVDSMHSRFPTVDSWLTHVSGQVTNLAKVSNGFHKRYGELNCGKIVTSCLG